MIRDILLQLSSYPAPTPGWVFDALVPLAERLDARVSAALCQVHIPRVSNFLADALVGANDAIVHENTLSREQASQLADAFAARIPAPRRGAQHLLDSTSFVASDDVARLARIFDLLVLPAHDGQHAALAEAAVFAAGRPVLLLPEAAATVPWERIVIGWDGGRAAARALADALPFCRIASDIQIVGVTGEKPRGSAPGLDAVCAHLLHHGIAAEPREVAADGTDAGTALLRHAAAVDAQLLVAGAYGHSRMREFILGGATRSLIATPELPILLSH